MPRPNELELPQQNKGSPPTPSGELGGLLALSPVGGCSVYLLLKVLLVKPSAGNTPSKTKYVPNLNRKLYSPRLEKDQVNLVVSMPSPVIQAADEVSSVPYLRIKR